ncbi:MAG TPA: PfkB family carbohydrate kinase [Candidatus Woesebacteria bacterium]|nr:PfkB family carbohydrate kinase [Candidatus Woesebacteria bacterium]
MKTLQNYTSIIVTGSIAYDDIMNFPGHFKDHFHPEKLHQINISFVVDQFVKHIGGTATNISYNIKQISDKTVYVCGGVGKDHEQITTFYKKNNINMDGLFIDKTLYTATGKVITDQTDNQIWGYYYGACAKGDNVDFAKLGQKSFGIISANHPKAFFHAQNYVIKHTIPYLYDPGMALTFIKDAELLEGINNCMFLVGNDYEIAQMMRRLDTSVHDFIEKGIVVITTLGAEGVLYQDTETELIVKAFPVKQIVDPTGAGDAWRGGFIGSLIEGKEVEESLKVANALASFVVESAGTVNHVVSKKEILERAKQLFIHTLFSL